MTEFTQVNPSSGESAASPLTVVVMAKPAVAGRVKTRLIGSLSAGQAAAVHAAMLACVLERLSLYLPGQKVLALDGAAGANTLPSSFGAGPQGRVGHGRATSGRDRSSGVPSDARPCGPALNGLLDVSSPPDWRVIDQGTGDLGERLDHVWCRIGRGAVAFFGVDSPDVPESALRAIPRALAGADAAVGPVEDGGYWTLAARRYAPGLLRGIDWGTQAVYHQTRIAGERAGLTLAALPAWHDVDEPDDLAALRRRLDHADEPALARLRDRLRSALAGT